LRVARDPTTPNLRQVHLIHAELFNALRAARFTVRPGQMGENITTRGIDLLGLATGTRLHLGAGNLVRKAGIMGIVLASGEVRPGDPIRVEPPPPPLRPLAPV
jgi:MOSC domain-containing protein YiiM